MTAQEVRNEIIRENIPKLIKAITGLDDDENLRRCEQFAFSRIRNHRHLSTSSHEVRRKIEGIKEKFIVDNCAEYAEYLGHMCDEIINHPICAEHYEVDVQWSILDLLFTLAYNPSAYLRRNKDKIDLNAKILKSEIKPSETSFLKDLLQENFLEVKDYNDNESDDLSDWSDDDTPKSPIDSDMCSTDRNSQSITPDKTAHNELSVIKLPERTPHYISYKFSDAKQRLLNGVQHTWWLQNATNMKARVESEYVEANFATKYNKFVSDISNRLIPFEEPATTTENNLMREILWMFHSPVKCKFFSVQDNIVRVRGNVTIPSITINGLTVFLKQHFVPHINIMNDLRMFLGSMRSCENIIVPKTLENYAANLRILLEPVWEKILEYEKKVFIQRDFEITTVIDLFHYMRTSMRFLEQIYSVHHKAVLSLEQMPPHISSAFLLTTLLHCNQTANNTNEANLAISLFLTSVKEYFSIIDGWWTDGRLEDYQQEFVVQSDSNTIISAQLFSKDKIKKFYLPKNVSQTITNSNFIRLLIDHSLEAGYTLNLLYEINQIGNLKNICDTTEGNIYNVFINEIMSYVKKLQSQSLQDVVEHDTPFENGSGFHQEMSNSSSINNNINASILNSLTTSDEFLLFAVTSDLNKYYKEENTIVEEHKFDDLSALQIFKELQSGKQILPLEEVILNSISKILKNRIALANSYVIKLYQEEFYILRHLRNIRRVLLLEASDVMYQFYYKLFHQIESEGVWSNAFLLSQQLSAALCTKFPDVSSAFHFKINSTFRCETTKVIEAVDELVIDYDLSRELSYVISDDDIEDYNKVFRFLLKVKWGLMTLENLQFPRVYKQFNEHFSFGVIDLTMRRLQHIRFWMMYAIQAIHCHLMTHVLQSMGQQLDEKIAKCENLNELRMVHKSYLSTVCEHCFVSEKIKDIKFGIEQFLMLISVLRSEWSSCSKHIEEHCNPLSMDLSDSSGDGIEHNGIPASNIDSVETTYIRCHQYMASRLKSEVYLKQKNFLYGLSEAFNYSLPY